MPDVTVGVGPDENSLQAVRSLRTYDVAAFRRDVSCRSTNRNAEPVRSRLKFDVLVRRSGRPWRVRIWNATLASALRYAGTLRGLDDVEVLVRRTRYDDQNFHVVDRHGRILASNLVRSEADCVSGECQRDGIGVWLHPIPRA